MENSPTKVSVVNSPTIKMSLETNLHNFITSIAENREAFDLFKQQAQKKGLILES